MAMTKRQALERRAAAALELRRRKALRKTVIGFVCPIEGHTHSLQQDSKGKWKSTDKPADMYLAAKFEKVVTSTKRFIILIGGRGSSKSVGVVDVCIADGKDNSAKTYCLREFQSSIKNSVYSLIKDEIGRLQFPGFDIQSTSIGKEDKEIFEFAGLARNVDSIKSSHGFKRFFVEEAQFLSQDSLDELTPTARKKPKKGLPGNVTELIQQDHVSIIFVANPGSSEDPFSKRFLVPFQEHIDRDGFYEDDLHLIIKMNYDDNPWFMDSGLEIERQWDYENRSRAYYDHRWLGAYNDSVEDALILPEWFDACIDAHLHLGIEPSGAKIAAHDPSDGGDPAGYILRHGWVVLAAEEKQNTKINDAAHWATGLAIQHGAHYFTWDGDGMGCGLSEQIASDTQAIPMQLVMFKGSEGVDNPDAIYKPAISAPVLEQRTNKDAILNKRAQYYALLADKCYRTYRAVVHGEKYDTDEMISFSSDIAILSKLRSELLRLPLKKRGDGKIALYTKEEMKTKLKIASPNLGDPTMMSLRYIPVQRKQVYIPRPTQPIRTSHAHAR